jgi:hypothetical protein
MPSKAWLVAILLFAGNANGAEIALAASAFDKALRKEAFKRDGKLLLTGAPGECTYAYLETPTSAFRGGRLIIRAHFSGRAGVVVAGNCVSAGEAFWVTVSGRPVLRQDVLALEDVRVDEAKAEYRQLLAQALPSHMTNALNINLREELLKLLRSGDVGYALTLPRLLITGVESEADFLRLRFDFTLEAR